jgi:hypothetical protein
MALLTETGAIFRCRILLPFKRVISAVANMRKFRFLKPQIFSFIGDLLPYNTLHDTNTNPSPALTTSDR